jgi:hypothetical protein
VQQECVDRKFVDNFDGSFLESLFPEAGFKNGLIPGGQTGEK